MKNIIIAVALSLSVAMPAYASNAQCRAGTQAVNDTYKMGMERKWDSAEAKMIAWRYGLGVAQKRGIRNQTILWYVAELAEMGYIAGVMGNQSIKNDLLKSACMKMG